MYVWVTDHGLIFSRVRSSGSLKYINPRPRTLQFVCGWANSAVTDEAGPPDEVFFNSKDIQRRQSHRITKLRLLFPDGWRLLVFALLLYAMISCSAASPSSWITSSERTYQSIDRNSWRFNKLRLLCWDLANQEEALSYSKVHFFNLLLKFWY